MAPAQVQDILAIKNVRAVDVEKEHDGMVVCTMFKAQHMTDFVHSRGVDFIAVHILGHHLANSDLSLEISPIRDLRPSCNRMTQNVWGSINDS